MEEIPSYILDVSGVLNSHQKGGVGYPDPCPHPQSTVDPSMLKDRSAGLGGLQTVSPNPPDLVCVYLPKPHRPHL